MIFKHTHVVSHIPTLIYTLTGQNTSKWPSLSPELMAKILSSHPAYTHPQPSNPTGRTHSVYLKRTAKSLPLPQLYI